MTSTKSPQSLKLELAQHSGEPGGALEGKISLQFPSVLDNKFKGVHLKLRGLLKVTIVQKTSDKSARATVEHTHDLIKEKIVIWEPGIYPPPAEHMLTLPFRFVLPEHLPATCKHSATERSKGAQITGEVSYHVEVVGSRSALRSNKRERASFRMTAPFAHGAQLQHCLTPSWSGEWRTITRHNSIRLGNSGRFSRVEMTFSVPRVDAMPSHTDVPYTLSVITSTPRIDRDETSDTEFPAPPSKPQDIDFMLERILRIEPQGGRKVAANVVSCVSRLGGMGPGQVVLRNGGPVQAEVTDRTWLPSYGNPQKGSWRQEVKFQSCFRLICPPTLVTNLMRVEYRIRLIVNFPGNKAALEYECPVNVIASSPPASSPSASMDEAMLELGTPGDTPPAYSDNVSGFIEPDDAGTRQRPTAFPDSDASLQERYRNVTIGPAWL